MQLTTFSVRGLRSLHDLRDVPVRKPTVLTGANDSGKSTALLALKILLADQSIEERDLSLSPAGERATEVVVEGVFAVGPAEQAELGLDPEAKIRRVARGGASQLEVSCIVPEDARLRGLASRPLMELKQIAEEVGVTPVGPKTAKATYLAALEEHSASLPTTVDWVAVDRRTEAALPVLLFFDGVAPESPQDAVQKALSVAYRGHLADSTIKERVTGIEKELEERLTVDGAALCSHLSNRCTDLDTVSVRPSVALAGKGLAVELSTGPTGAAVPLAASGAGRSRRISLATWEWTAGAAARAGDDDAPARDVLIAYDEPDTHLDYTHQRTIMKMIDDQCAGSHIAMIIATHSMNLIDGVDLDSIVHLTQEDGRTRVTRLGSSDGHAEADAMLRNLAADVGLRNSVLIHERLFVGMEGESEEKAMPILFRKYTGRHAQAAGIALWPCRGNVGAVRFAEFLMANGRRVAFVVDHDSKVGNRSHFTERKLARVGLTPAQTHYVGGPNELEELFTDERWAAVANEQWPRTDGRPWEIADIRACRKGKFSATWCETISSASGIRLTKPMMAFEVARSIHAPEDVPAQLRTIFDALLELAAD
ncbi:MAG: hypothetical protein H7Y15_09830 [Pseudonocardia sp.]|nr:hypothetical protein [Pseudonocardia sp.]